MRIQRNIQLAPYTTFKIGGMAKFFCTVNDEFDALEAFDFAKKNKLNVFVLGGGSNLLISNNGFNGLVIKVENKGIEIISNEKAFRIRSGMTEEVLLKVASGENWDEVVKFSVNNNWWGMENLSHIPGSVGAIAVQNVGAYGQEASNIIKSVVVFDKHTSQILELKNSDCKFSYRQSIFNTTHKGRYIIFYINFSLSKHPKPILSYKDLSVLSKNANIKEIRQEIIKIRNKKFPFPVKAKNGNAGSFFKNIEMENSKYNIFKVKIADLFGVNYGNLLENKVFKSKNKIKIPTAFILDLCDLKDLKQGGAKINHNQPLVIVNHSGKATSKDVLDLAKIVCKTVYKKLGVKLQIEPELLGFEKKELIGIL